MADRDITTVVRFAVTALLFKNTRDGFNYRLMLDVIEAPDQRSARASYAITAMDAYPEHGVEEVLAVEVV